MKPLARSIFALGALLVCVPLGGCITTAGLVRKQDVSIPILITAGVADFVVTSVAAAQLRDFSTGGAVATGLALTAADLVAGCFVGACSQLPL